MSYGVGERLTRRGAIGLLAAVGASAAAPSALAFSDSLPLPAEVAATIRFRSIVIDTSRLASGFFGWSDSSRVVHAALVGPVGAAFSDRLAPGDARAPTLVVRVDSIYTAPGDGRVGHGRSKGPGAMDAMEGAGLVIGPNRRVISVTPILSAFDTATGGFSPGDPDDVEQRRLGALATHFTLWLKREMGLG